MNASGSGSWLWSEPDAISRPLAVVHFPHAGGFSAAYRSWVRWYPADVAFLGVELPGRGQRVAAAPMVSIEAAAAEIAMELRAWSDHQVALFGHSMGALLAFEVARRASTAGWEASVLVVSGSRAPCEDLGRPRIGHLRQPEFGIRAVELGFTTAEVGADPELAELFLAPLRADLALCESYQWGKTDKVQVAISVLCGRDDNLVPLSSARSWQRMSANTGSVTILGGGHMFVLGAAQAVVRHICAAIRPPQQPD